MSFVEREREGEREQENFLFFPPVSTVLKHVFSTYRRGEKRLKMEPSQKWYGKKRILDEGKEKVEKALGQH